jgi:putative hydrolase of the HAD superfamily
MTVEAVCFDLDDTLYDYHQYARMGLRSAANHLEERTGQQFHGELLDLYFDDEVTEGTFDVLVDRHDLPDDLVDELVEAYHDATGTLSPYDHTYRLLSQLREEYDLGLITDGREGHAKLRRLGVQDYFDAVLVTPQIGRSKHDPSVFERVLAQLSVPPWAAVYVGDDPRVDFRVPNELHMGTVRLRKGRYAEMEPESEQAAADHEITRLTDLPAVLERVEATEAR